MHKAKKPLKAAVVGLTQGAGHAAAYASMEEVGELVLCDKREETLREVGDRLHVQKRYTDFEQMLEKEHPDLISLATPNFLHMPMAVCAMEAGCHVLCEKPMARNAQEAKKMQKAAEDHHRILMVHFNQRFEPATVALKRAAQEGLFGQIYAVRTIWQRQRGVPWWYPLERGKETCGGGALVDLGVHMLDRALYLCDYPKAEWVLGNTYSEITAHEAKSHGLTRFELEDMGVAMIRLENGTMVELEASWAANREDEKVMTRIYGTKGGAVADRLNGTLFLDRGGKVESVPLVPEEGPSTCRIFLDTVLGKRENPCPPEQGVAVCSLLDAIYQSAAEGAPICLKG